VPSDPVSPVPQSAGRAPQSVGRWLRPLVGIGLFLALLVYANPRQVASTLAGASAGWLIAAVALVLIDRTLNAYRWLWLLRSTPPGRTVPVRSVLHVFFVSTFLGSFLPAGIGGDAVRTVALSRLQMRMADAFASVLVDRLLGVVSVLVMGLAGLVVVRGLIEAQSLGLLALGAGILLAASALLLFEQRWIRWAVRRLAVGHLTGLTRRFERALDAVTEYRHDRRTLLLVLAASIGVQVLRTLQAWCLGVALGIPATLPWYFAFLPVIILVMQLPISIAGLGTGTAAFQVLFGTIGVGAADAFALSLLFSALGLVGNVPGAVLFAFDRRRGSHG
jgi:uncharacterized protein (TIRG00374 family)